MYGVWYMISILECIIINMRDIRLVIALYCSLHMILQLYYIYSLLIDVLLHMSYIIHMYIRILHVYIKVNLSKIIIFLLYAVAIYIGQNSDKSEREILLE